MSIISDRGHDHVRSDLALSFESALRLAHFSRKFACLWLQLSKLGELLLLFLLHLSAFKVSLDWFNRTRSEGRLRFCYICNRNMPNQHLQEDACQGRSRVVRNQLSEPPSPLQEDQNTTSAASLSSIFSLMDVSSSHAASSNRVKESGDG